MSDSDYWNGRLDAEEGLKEVAAEAISQINRGKFEDAVLTLERNFFPTWQDAADCEVRYREVMGRA